MKKINLKFRRQYLLSPKRIDSLDHWQHTLFCSSRIYTHPDIELNIAETDENKFKLALIGYILDPSHPDRSNIAILNDILESIDTINDISEYLYNMSGRFVLIVNSLTDMFVFHDPCGLRTVYYTKYKGEVYIGSQPLIFEYIMPLKKGDTYNKYEESEYKKSHIEHWIPSGYSLYDDIYHLVPNHYLQFSTLEQERYWPSRKLQKIQLDDAVHETSELLKKIMEAANNRFRLALSLTAGVDSRLVLSASKNIASNMFFYTLQYRDLQMKSRDIRTPKKLLNFLGYKHNLIDCRNVFDMEFNDIYEKNVSMAHGDDWGRIAYGMINKYPQDRICVKGNCVEIARCYYYEHGSHQPIISPDQIIELEDGWHTLAFVNDHISTWYNRTKEVANNTNIDILDLFYWEHRMGSWQAQSQLEWDIVQECFTPFNHRGLLEITLGVSPKFRSAPNYILYQKIAETLWPEVMEYPINPPENMKERLIMISSYFGLKEIARKTYKKFFR